jgi:hypothetical protein
MPIGKNALKRVSNNGYSKVNTSAPDMEDSVITEEPILVLPVLEEPAPAPKKRGRPAKKAAPIPEEKVEEKPLADEPAPAPKKRGRPAKKDAAKPEESKPAQKKPAARKPKKKSAPKPAEPKKAKATDDVTHPDGFVKIACGMDMPSYLL